MYQAPNAQSYNALVYLIVAQIPPGRVSTYGQIASMIPPPEGVEPPTYERLSPRWVGAAMRKCTDAVPWFRVINSQGTISLPPGPGADEQRFRLEAEGVTFNANGRVDLKAIGWDGPDAEWLRANGLFAPYSLKRKGQKT
ncbi:MAG TPA: MGMT family protein [Phototrophicaceae bacterium]|nr:MGMT family protein [Phototrophicaceae bacterium]